MRRRSHRSIAFRELEQEIFAYLDFGAYDPIHLNKTYLHYRVSCRGVCIEPNTMRCASIHRKRPEYYLNHPEKAAEIGRAAQIRVRQQHGWSHRFRQILAEVKLIR